MQTLLDKYLNVPGPSVLTIVKSCIVQVKIEAMPEIQEFNIDKWSTQPIVEQYGVCSPFLEDFLETNAILFQKPRAQIALYGEAP